MLRADDRAAIAEAVRAIAAGELVGLPTETVYGVACALTDAALDRLLAAKGRPASKGITLLVDSVEDVLALADLSTAARRLAARFWPGPLTLVLPARKDVVLPDLLTGGQRTVGFRLPDHPVPRALARELGALPLTSANLSGDPDSVDADGVVRALGPALALVLDGGRAPGGVPSTVAAILHDEHEPVVLRAGAIEPSRIRDAAADAT